MDFLAELLSIKPKSEQSSPDKDPFALLMNSKREEKSVSNSQ